MFCHVPMPTSPQHTSQRSPSLPSPYTLSSKRRLCLRARTSEDGRSSRGSTPRARHTQERAFERAKRQQLKSAYYQRGSSWGKTASGILFDVAHAINLDDNLLLWYVTQRGWHTQPVYARTLVYHV